MSDQLTNEQKNQALFLQLIMSFQMAAMQHMGKTKNILTDKIEKDMQQAQLSIEMIDMMKAKTKGNLSQDEVNFVDHVLRELRLNYVEELNKNELSDKEKADNKKKEENTSEGKNSEKNR